MTTHKE